MLPRCVRLSVVVSPVCRLYEMYCGWTVRPRAMAWDIKWSFDRWLYTWPQRCCEAVRSAILATAWLLVLLTNERGLIVLIVQCSLRRSAQPGYNILWQVVLPSVCDFSVPWS